MYSIVSFLASHVTLIGIFGGVCASLAALAGFFVVAMPALEAKLRPPEYIYIGWIHEQDIRVARASGEIVGDVVLRSVHRYEWEHNYETMTLPMPEPPGEFNHQSLRNGVDMKVLVAVVPVAGNETIVMEPYRGQRYQLRELNPFIYEGVLSRAAGIEWYWWPWIPEDKVTITRGTNAE